MCQCRGGIRYLKMENPLWVSMEEIKYWDSRQFAHHPLVREGNKFWVVNYVQLTVNSEQESFIRAFIILVTNWPLDAGTPPGPGLTFIW